MENHSLSRREALGVMAAGVLAAKARAAAPPKRFSTRGVVLYPWDLSLSDWPERARKAGITTIGLHAARRLDVLADFVQSEQGRHFLKACRKLGVAVEYEVHAIGTLLSREWFCSPDKQDMFRMDASGRRNPDFNCCPSSPEALGIVAKKAVEYGRLLKPTTGRYYFWPDDAREWCCCPKCGELTGSDQAVLVENAIIAALRKDLDPKALLSHIAYSTMLPPPKNVKPHEGLFLEFAPIARVYDHPIDDASVQLNNAEPEPKTQIGYLGILDANLEMFPRDTAQVLEYWLDVSRFSGWKRPTVQIPWSDAVMKADANAYAKRGIRNVTTFATWIDADYVKRFGEPPLAAYAAGLNG
jgi:hypothetical protein